MTVVERKRRSEATILVTGVTGQIGSELVRTMQGLGKVVAVDRATFDLTEPNQMRAVIRAIKPTVIVNPAAYTAVDAAQSNPDLAMQVNAKAPGVLAEEARRVGAAMIHYSTDYVFNGEKDSPYVEEDEADPKNVYGFSKLAGERAIASAGAHHLILRTSWVYGMRGRNFLLTMLRLGTERDEIKVVADQFGAPTWSNTIATLTAHIVSQALAAHDTRQWWQERSGLYHLTAAGSTSWHGFAKAIFDAIALERVPTVMPIPSSDFPTQAERPANSCLSNGKLERVFGLQSPQWDQALKLCLQSHARLRDHPVS
ncbi:dTDP-4-dehydrorhamnose reductase [Mycetohabitans rhizoxinica HKI 454]|uniref:dTDP-4-dehydrorhamnose reductase n=2 Tax=Mycetohabitans rhizoxinica TaxID=412963 RepID=E5AKR7_MYCRK|nr:dTDP-4-dehydrorhamnose reductase [Mycetohabitans rhizoxinica]CBK52866.1 dTDP-4-dehydrorhamnose reductase [Mycetohabitans rhizoxinica HKI 454]CBW75874.1 dTDP-4-dehydrorhamnose reductase [Mycetohabitans rhizoxinica HKI 454]